MYFHCVQKNTLYHLKLLNLLTVCFMTWHKTCPGECSCMLEKNVFCWCWVECSIDQNKLVGSVIQVLYHLLFSSTLIMHDADTNCFYYVQPIIQVPSNVLLYFKFNPHCNAERGGSLVMPMVQRWNLRLRNISVFKW